MNILAVITAERAEALNISYIMDDQHSRRDYRTKRITLSLK